MRRRDHRPVPGATRPRRTDVARTPPPRAPRSPPPDRTHGAQPWARRSTPARGPARSSSAIPRRDRRRLHRGPAQPASCTHWAPPDSPSTTSTRGRLPPSAVLLLNSALLVAPARYSTVASGLRRIPDLRTVPGPARRPTTAQRSARPADAGGGGGHGDHGPVDRSARTRTRSARRTRRVAVGTGEGAAGPPSMRSRAGVGAEALCPPDRPAVRSPASRRSLPRDHV